MKIEIMGILDRGVREKERLWLKVLSDTSLEYFIVFDTTYVNANAISNLQRHAYWFEPKKVRAGDFVVLYTRKGVKSEARNADGSTSHFLFWGVDSSVWNNAGDCAVIFEVSTWQTSKYGG